MASRPDKKTITWIRGITIGTELAFTIVICTFLGYFIGRKFGEIQTVLGLTIGLLFGFFIGIKRILSLDI
ncbi:MAG: AtpZ/AtpI family protein [Candidatus Hydrothermarchaeota archaeon]